jgi:hypothetical protein
LSNLIGVQPFPQFEADFGVFLENCNDVREIALCGPKRTDSARKRGVSFQKQSENGQFLFGLLKLSRHDEISTASSLRESAYKLNHTPKAILDHRSCMQSGAVADLYPYQ